MGIRVYYSARYVYSFKCDSSRRFKSHRVQSNFSNFSNYQNLKRNLNLNVSHLEADVINNNIPVCSVYEINHKEKKYSIVKI